MNRFRGTIAIACAAVAGLLAPTEILYIDHNENNGRVRLSRDFLAKPSYPIVFHGIDLGLDAFKQFLWPIDKETLIQAAIYRSGGLTRFYWESEYWNQGLDKLLFSIEHDARGIHALGWLFIRENIIQSLENQLRVMDIWHRHRERMVSTENSPVLVLAGLPRTGSTALQRLLCLHPDVDCLEFYQAIQPVETRGIDPSSIGTSWDWRVLSAHCVTQFLYYLRPLLSRMHVMGARMPCEETHITAHVFGSLLFEASLVNLTTYSNWYMTTDH
eukprot:CAMPEP_0203759572 /NCGR_PEP_ID=MMETSP0098-20131031/12622_1 /ASSEMBLY_ACC=CAM_ASM_000208 /TAXON_ID=96639 /ORGANISM=" , Strain NY0313808BC1" /LENGTH=271 /DNA_ID=CAMNT_0050652601 /DNA_START=134 /DNA_END=946 /DNA_ORIENTATION=-